jgi:cysteine desulfurase
MGDVYLDNAASTRPADEVLDIATDAARRYFANPSSAHAWGAAAARALEQARTDVATALQVAPSEIVFTSGGTEGNALALRGAAARARGRHVVVTAIEHPAVMRNVEHLAQDKGFELTIIPVDASGVVAAEAVAAAVRPETAIVAVMLVNNELGTVQPVARIAQALRARAASGGPPGTRMPHFHVDAVQAFGLIPFSPLALGADSLAISGHKIHGPKGTGALWLRRGARVAPLWDGGRQERGLRSGTENVPGILGFARAAILASGAHAASGIAALRDDLETRVLAAVPQARPTVATGARAPHICSLSIPGLPAEPLLHALEARGVMASAGSACASKSRGPSPVLKAIGIDDDTAVLRFSLSRETTSDDVRVAVDALTAAVAEIAAATAPRSRRAVAQP